MLKIGALWRREKKDDEGNTKVFFSGNFDIPCPMLIDKNTSIICFKNKSEHEKAPALDIFIAENKPKQSNRSDEPIEL